MYFECEATKTQLEMGRKAKAIRQRLTKPVTAIQDTPIHLKRTVGITGYQAKINAQEAAARAERTRAQASKDLQVAIAAKMADEIERIENQGRDWLLPNNQKQDSYPLNFLHYIKQVVAGEFGLTPVEVLNSARRSHDIVIPRHVAQYLCKILTPKSLPEIGRAFGGMDHSSVHNAAKKMPGRMHTDADLCQRVVWLQAKIEDDLAKWRAG